MAPPTGHALTRLAIAIRDECDRRGWKQEDLIRESGIGRSTIQRLWKDTNTVVPGRRTKRDLERVFEWVDRSVDAILAGGNPLPQRDEHGPPPGLGIDPREWAKWDPIDREMVLNAVRAARQRARRQQPDDVSPHNAA
jgi:transcriptional regulator with XRE-family HTH domain